MPDPDLKPGDVLVTLHDRWHVDRIRITLRNETGDTLVVSPDYLPKVERLERGN